MSATLILNRLQELFDEISTKGIYDHTDYLANETRILAAKAIALINLYPSLDKPEEISNLKAKAIEGLKKAMTQADRYYNISEGYSSKTRSNNKVEDSEFINPAYEALEYFLDETKNDI